MLVNGSAGHDVKKNTTQERQKNIHVTFARKYISTGKKLGSEQSSTCFSPSLPNPVLLVVFLKSGDKNVTVSGFGQNTQINLIICKNIEVMVGSQYLHTTRSLLKTGLLLLIISLLLYCSLDKIIISIEDGSILSLNS